MRAIKLDFVFGEMDACLTGVPQVFVAGNTSK